MIRKRVVAHGHVQGVFFRETTRRLAERSAVAGWVRNTPEGTVEAVFEGRRADVDRLIQFMRKGPRGADVERIDVTDEPLEGFTGFAVR